MNSRTINIDDIYIKTDHNTRRSFKNVIEATVNKLYKRNKLSDDEYHSLGGSKTYGESQYHKIFESSSFVYPKPIVCHSCKKNSQNKLTDNKPGFACFVSISSKNDSYNIKTKCASCDKMKNSYINLKTLPDKYIQKIKKARESIEPKSVNKNES